MRRRTLISLVLVLVLASLSFASVAAQDEELPATVYVGHGIPGLALELEDNALPVDVLVNDEICLLEGFEFGEFAGPVELDAGEYNIKISLASANPEEDPPIESCQNEPVIEADVEFEADTNYTVFAHLTEDGELTASVFENDVTPVVAGHTRLTVRHTAAVGAVDITLYRGWSRGRMVGEEIEGLANPEEAGPLDIRPGNYEAIITLAEVDEADNIPLKLEALEPHTAYIAYAVGGLESETFEVLIQDLDLGMMPPPRPELPTLPELPPSPELPTLPEVPVPPEVPAP